MKFKPIILCLICLAGLVACEVNTMYNARNYFKSAQERPLNNMGRPNAQAIDEYTKAIKKCGIIISESRKNAKLDEAYYLMSRALYFKGNSAFQAKDQFENLINRYPNSPLVPDSKIFIARILREINQPREAEKKLDEFILNPKYKKHHPKALFLMADFAIKDKNYTRAQYYLERIINDYPKTKEYREAYFLFGKNYYEQNDYPKSLEAFQKMQNARGIDKTLKMDGSYYIGLNELELGNFDRALRTTKSLVKNETRPEKISAVRLLKARIQFALNDTTAATSEIDYINKNYPRTESSAAAYYYLAEYQYYKTGDIAKAVANYNRVRTEFSTSPLSSKGQAKATALGKLIAPANLSSETNLSTWLDYYYQAAESFLGALALPDSALATYKTVIAEKSVTITRIDSLNLKLNETKAVLDSLKALPIVADNPILPDTLVAIDGGNDSLKVAISDSTFAVPDSFKVAISDSTHSVPDSLNPQVALQAQIQRLQTELTDLETRITKQGENLLKFDAEIIPFCLFAIGSILQDYASDDPENEAILSRMQSEYPENKYARALSALQSGQPVRLIDPLEERQEKRLDELFGQIEAQPDSAVVGLEALTSSIYPAVKLAANYRLGWYYSFEAVDTLAAKPYLDEVLENTAAEEYTSITRRFYNGTKFLLFEIPTVDSSVIDSTMVAPSSKGLVFPGSAEIWTNLPDSLSMYQTIPPLIDSLSNSIAPPQVPDSEPSSIDQIPSEIPASPPPDLEKKEEAPLE